MQAEMLDSTISNSMQLFENEQFGRVRVIMRDGDPWFVAKDVCECLDLSNVSQACSRLDEDETIVLTRGELGSVSNIISNDIRLDDNTVLSNRGLILVSEPGLYSLVGSSKKPEAKAFKRWVNHEVLPSIRKTGSYSVVQSQPQPALPTTYLEALEALVASEKAKLALQAERDEAIRTKYQFVEGRDAKVCGELGGLRTQNEALRKQIGDSKTYKAAKAIPWLSEYFNTRNRGLYISLASKLNKIEADMPSEFAHTKIEDSQYGQINAYHVAVIEKLHEMVQADEEFMKDYRKDVSPKTKNA